MYGVHSASRRVFFESAQLCYRFTLLCSAPPSFVDKVFFCVAISFSFCCTNNPQMRGLVHLSFHSIHSFNMIFQRFMSLFNCSFVPVSLRFILRPPLHFFFVVASYTFFSVCFSRLFFLSKTFSAFFTKAGKNEGKVSIAESMDG